MRVRAHPLLCVPQAPVSARRCDACRSSRLIHTWHSDPDCVRVESREDECEDCGQIFRVVYLQRRAA